MSDELPERTLAIFAGQSNKKLIARLRAEGETIVEFPFVEAVAAEDVEAAIESALDDLSAFDWLIFPDLYAVEFFLQNLRAHQIDFFRLDDLRICAFGESVSDRLRFVQLHADVIPLRLDTTSVFAALRDYLSVESEFENLRILIAREATAELELSESLRRKKAAVTEISVYRMTTENVAGLTRLKALLKGGAVDEFIFTAPAEVFALKNIFRRDLKDLLNGVSVSAADETTFQTLREHNLRPLYRKKN